MHEGQWRERHRGGKEGEGDKKEILSKKGGEKARREEGRSISTFKGPGSTKRKRRNGSIHIRKEEKEKEAQGICQKDKGFSRRSRHVKQKKAQRYEQGKKGGERTSRKNLQLNKRNRILLRRKCGELRVRIRYELTEGL